MIGNKDDWCNQDYTLSDLPAAAAAAVLFAAELLLLLQTSLGCSPNREEACSIVFRFQKSCNIVHLYGFDIIHPM